MPKKIVLTMEQENLIRDLFASVPKDIGSARRRQKGSIKPIIQKLQAAGINLCEDTIRRRAAKLGLIEPVGAKYIPKENQHTWTRPCMICKTTKPRPRLQYMCEACRVRDYGV